VINAKNLNMIALVHLNSIKSWNFCDV